ncbi:hypothetical protein N0V90_012354 [Kalmusia sp. IMI 367209]|nr:hypothetical protein N0V90_012354 [Kalmusia sp. IMI 367209]
MSALQGLSNLVSLSVSHVALNPVVTAALLWALTKGPANVRERLLNAIPPVRRAEVLARATKALKWLLALGLAGTVNRKLNELALNAYRVNNEKKRWKWSQEVAVVTGGCSGIGLLLVKRLVLKGVKVAILDVQQLPPALQGYAAIKFFACDISDPAAVAGAAEKIKATLGSPSILVNNAGITQPHTILNTSPEYLRKIFEVNLFSNWYTVQAFLPDMMQKNKGHIVNVASLASYWTVGGMVDYAATKAADMFTDVRKGLTQEIRQKHKASNILLTSVHPNWVRTPLLEPYAARLRAGGQALLEPAAVANAMAEQIFRCSSGQIVVPSRAARAGTSVKGWPNWLQEAARGSLSKIVLSGTE